MSIRPVGTTAAADFTLSKKDIDLNQGVTHLAVHTLEKALEFGDRLSPGKEDAHRYREDPKIFFQRALRDVSSFNRDDIAFIYLMMEETPLSSNVMLVDLFGTYAHQTFDSLVKKFGDDEGKKRVITSAEATFMRTFLEIQNHISLMPLDVMLTKKLHDTIEIAELEVCRDLKGKKSYSFRSDFQKLKHIERLIRLICIDQEGLEVFFHKILEEFPGSECLFGKTPSSSQKSICSFLEYLRLLFSEEEAFEELYQFYHELPLEERTRGDTKIRERLFKKIESVLIKLNDKYKREIELKNSFKTRQDQAERESEKAKFHKFIMNLYKTLVSRENQIDRVASFKRAYDDGVIANFNHEYFSETQIMKRLQCSITFFTSKQNPKPELEAHPFYQICREEIDQVMEQMRSCSKLFSALLFFSSHQRIDLARTIEIYYEYREIIQPILSTLIPSIKAKLEEHKSLITFESFLEMFVWIPIIYISKNDLDVLLEGSAPVSDVETLSPFLELLELTIMQKEIQGAAALEESSDEEIVEDTQLLSESEETTPVILVATAEDRAIEKSEILHSKSQERETPIEKETIELTRANKKTSDSTSLAKERKKEKKEEAEIRKRLRTRGFRSLYKLLKERGFELKRTNGSHHVLKDEKQTVVVPRHGSGEIATGTFLSIFNSATKKRD